VVDYERWGAMAVVIVLVAMLLGGNAGSTAGGFKISRYVVLMKNVALQVRRLLHPKAVTALYVDGNRVGVDTLGIITAFAWIFILSNVVLTFYLYARGYDLLTALSAAIATIGNIGPGFGRVGVVENYAFFSATDKLVLSAAMIAGRLEFFTVLLLFSRTYWRRF
jgi:trk system potassium uptake protein TrkH